MRRTPSGAGPEGVPSSAETVADQAVAPAVISSSAFSSLGASVSMKLLTENTAFPAPGGP
jgi:hypothetical protein